MWVLLLRVLLPPQGFGLPFDRHDWVVDRCGKEVREGEGAGAGAGGRLGTGLVGTGAWGLRVKASGPGQGHGCGQRLARPACLG